MKNFTLPGLIDPHVHLRDPYQTEKEDFYTGTCAALAGGYTTIIDMPNNKTPITTLERLEEKIAIAQEKVVCDIGFHFGSLGDNLEEFGKLFFHPENSPQNTPNSRVLGLKLYLNETTGNFLIDKAKLKEIFKAWPGYKPILLHAEDDAVRYVIEIVRQTGKRSHFCHISTSADLKQIMAAKQEGLPITCGVTPHHLFLTDTDAEALGPFGRMKPPLRSKKEVEFLWKHIDAIDVVESDHAPHTIKEKQNTPSPFGVPGLETTLPLLLTAVSKKRLSIDDVVRLCSENPSKIFGIHHPKSTKVEIDVHKTYTIENKNLFTKCGWTPFAGQKVTGKIQKVFIRGKKVFEGGKILVKPGFGKILPT